MIDDTFKASRAKMFATFCPPLYQESDLSRFPEHTKRILAWQYNPVGLFIQGPSRTYKTRATWAMLRQHFLRGRSLVYFDGVGWGIQCARAFSDCDRSEQFLGNWLHPDIFFIDDLFKSRVTEAVETGLYALLERRASHLKPVIITSNATGLVMKSMMTDAGQKDRFNAIMERIREFSEVVLCE